MDIAGIEIPDNFLFETDDLESPNSKLQDTSYNLYAALKNIKDNQSNEAKYLSDYLSIGITSLFTQINSMQNQSLNGMKKLELQIGKLKTLLFWYIFIAVIVLLWRK